jgi:hypothetical protein
MCGYCCGGVPVDKRGEGHKGCSAECYNAPDAARVARLVARAKAEAWEEGYDARGRDIANEGLTERTLTPNPYRVTSPAVQEGLTRRLTSGPET